MRLSGWRDGRARLVLARLDGLAGGLKSDTELPGEFGVSRPTCTGVEWAGPGAFSALQLVDLTIPEPKDGMCRPALWWKTDGAGTKGPGAGAGAGTREGSTVRGRGGGGGELEG